MLQSSRQKNVYFIFNFSTERASILRLVNVFRKSENINGTISKKNPSAKEEQNSKDQEEENNNDLQSKYLTAADPKESCIKKRLRWKDLPTDQGE